ncbi:hypothetical protein MKK69_23565 [Methylobacterium sp. J-026]|uniref:hypothetical protein n=1 Tax=Methylobacterium sp. J-026 TaxID=2836624 RepID=UPI001FB8B137|nr:hypothetical protein [Methylobacterium sp. J-026]MCJ2136990.1 hypothetical protein [Methylobacterium sp. J-026]
MSAGTGQPGGQQPNWGQVAAKHAEHASVEAHAAHRDTRRILQFLQGGGDQAEEDPMGAILEAQDAMMEQQEQIVGLLADMREEIGQLRAQMQAVLVRLGIG